MPIRELTDDEKARLLTQEEVNDLPDGTNVMIQWAGGNGPHKYALRVSEHVECPYVGGGREYVGVVNYVSDDPESTLTKVFLPDD